MDWKQLKELIELVSEKGFSEFEVERQGFRLKITQAGGEHGSPVSLMAHPGAAASQEPYSGSGQPSMAVLPSSAQSPGPVRGPAADTGESLHIIKSPIVGTFYRASSPQSEAFVKIGDRVEHDSVVCIIEAMKLMNEIQAETAGTIADIYVENGQPVEYNQPLFGVRT
jgi:acetyl-CoA carboxylase biotin carboxyl carrier protein